MLNDIKVSYNNSKIIDSKVIAITRLIAQSLATHNNLDNSDIIYTINTIVNNKNNYTYNDLMTTILYSCYYTNTGKYNTYFNTYLEYVIINRKTDELLSILKNPNNYFIELMDNDTLTNEELYSIITIKNMELLSIHNAVNDAKNYTIPENIIYFPLHNNNTIDNQLDDNINYIYDKAFHNVCIAESLRLFNNTDINNVLILKSYKIPENVLISDCVKNINSIFMLDYMTLIMSITLGVNYGGNITSINPATKLPFSKRTLDVLHTKYHKEIKMHNRYLSHMNMIIYKHELSHKSSITSILPKPALQINNSNFGL